MRSKTHGLLLHNDYATTYCAVTQNNSIVTYQTLPNRQAASHLIPTLAEVLEAASLQLFSCNYIAVNRGPTPFTTLRTVISTANGLSYATGIPLIGVDGLDALARHTYAPKCSHILVLLYAFRNDVYFGLYDHMNTAILYGWSSFSQFYDRLQEFAQSQQTTPRIYCVGNGVTDHYETLIGSSTYEAVIDTPTTAYADIQHIAETAYEQWQNNATERMLTPLYLKQTQAYVHQ